MRLIQHAYLQVQRGGDRRVRVTLSNHGIKHVDSLTLTGGDQRGRDGEIDVAGGTAVLWSDVGLAGDRVDPGHADFVGGQHALIGNPHRGAVQGIVGVERCAHGL
ncbi:hypothetical protein D3C77_317540 [compost metagenome]